MDNIKDLLFRGRGIRGCTAEIQYGITEAF